MSETWETLQAIERIDDSVALLGLYGRLLPLMKDAWNEPHSAMEYLEVAAEVLPYPLAHALVRKVVSHWRSLPNYEWSAGGNAGHCYLSALLLSGNAGLIEPELFVKWSSSSLSKANNLRDRTKDADAKREALEDSLSKIRQWVGGDSGDSED